MSTHEEDQSLNGRLRPRKSSVAGPPRSRLPRRSADERAKKPPPPAQQQSDADNQSPTPLAPPAPPQLQCLYCDKRFALKNYVAKHIARVHKDAPFECQFCKQAGFDAATAIRHMLDTHPTQYFACLECHSRFQSTTELTDHHCDKERPKVPTKPYRSKLRQKIKGTDNKRQKALKIDYPIEQKDFAPPPGFNGIVISCELKPAQTHDPADIEDNITTNLILPSNKSLMSGSPLEKNAVIVLDDVQWHKRVPANFSFHNSDADQILSRLGVVHRSPRTDASRATYRHQEETAKFERCFDTAFYTKVASNVHENMTKFLDGSFTRLHHDPDSVIKTRKAKNIVAIHTAEGFPILLACEQFKRNMHEAYMPRAIAPKHKWKWDSVESDRAPPLPAPDQVKRDAHVDKCIVTLVSSLDTWTQLSMRRRFDSKYNSLSFNEKKTEKQSVIGNELKEILESRVLPASSAPKYELAPVLSPPAAPASSRRGFEFPLSLGLVPRSIESGAAQAWSPPPAVLTGECVRPRCLVCCACGERAPDARALHAHSAARHPGAQPAHYEVVGEVLLHADILRHLYVPPAAARPPPRARPPRPRGARDCTKCAATVSHEELHEHMLECAGDTPAPRRKVRTRPFGVRRRRPRPPDNPPTYRARADNKPMRSRQQRQKRMRPRPKLRTEVGDAETIRKMIADLPAKRHRSLVTSSTSSTSSSSLRALRKRELPRNKTVMKRRPSEDPKTRKLRADRDEACSSNTGKPKRVTKENNKDDKPTSSKRVTRIAGRVIRPSEVFKRKILMRNAKRKSRPIIETTKEHHDDKPSLKITTGSLQTDRLPLDGNTPHRVDMNKDDCTTRGHAARDGSSKQSRKSGEEGRGEEPAGRGQANQHQPPLKHSIASLTANTETHDKAVQFQPHFLIQQECYKNFDNSHRQSGSRHDMYEDDAVTANIDKPPLDQPCTIDPFAHLRGKTNRPRKRLTDCIAMLKNKLDPEATSPGTGTGVQCDDSDMPHYEEPPTIGDKPQGSLLMEAPPPPAGKPIRAIRPTRKKREKEEPVTKATATTEPKITSPVSSTDSRVASTVSTQMLPAAPREQRLQPQILPVFTVSPPSNEMVKYAAKQTTVLPSGDFKSLASGHYGPAISPSLDLRSQKTAFARRASESPSRDVRGSTYSPSSISPSQEVRTLVCSSASVSPSNEIRSRAHSSSSASPSNDYRSRPYSRASVSPSNDLRSHSTFSRASVSPSNDARIHSMAYSGLNISPSRETMYQTVLYSGVNSSYADVVSYAYPPQSESYLTAAMAAPYTVTSTNQDYAYHTRQPGYEPSVLRSRRHKPSQSQPIVSPPKHRPKKKYAASAATLQQAQEMSLSMRPPDVEYPVVEAAAQRKAQPETDYRRRSSTHQFSSAETTASTDQKRKYPIKSRGPSTSSTLQANKVIQQRQTDMTSPALTDQELSRLRHAQEVSQQLMTSPALTDQESSRLRHAQEVSQQLICYEKEYQPPEAKKTSAHTMTRRSTTVYDAEQADRSSPSSFRTTGSSSVSPTSSTKDMPSPGISYKNLSCDFSIRRSTDYPDIHPDKCPLQDRSHQMSHEDYVQNLSSQNEYSYRQKLRDMQVLHAARRSEGDYSMVQADSDIPPAHLSTRHIFRSVAISGASPLDLSGKSSTGHSNDQYDSYGTIDLSSSGNENDLSAESIKQVDEFDMQLNEPEDLSIKTRHQEPDDCFIKPTCPVSESAKRIYDARAKAKMAQTRINRNQPMATYDLSMRAPDFKVRGLTTVITGANTSEPDIFAKCPVSITVTNTITSSITGSIAAQSTSIDGKSCTTSFKPITPVPSAALEYMGTATTLADISDNIQADDGKDASQPVYTVANASMNSATTTNSNSTCNNAACVETRTDSPTISITHTQAIRTEIIPQIGPVQDLDTANKIAMLPKEIVDILGQMPPDHRNQLLNVLPQYMVYNTAVKQLKFVVDITPEPLIAPVGVGSLSKKSEIATQTATSTETPCSVETTDSVADKLCVSETSTERARNESFGTEQMKATESAQEHALEAANLSPEVPEKTGNKSWMLKNDLEDPTPLASPGHIQTPPAVSLTHTSPVQTKEQKEGSKKTASLRAVRIKTSGKRKPQQNLTTKSVEEIAPTLPVTDTVMDAGEKTIPSALGALQRLITEKPETSSNKDNTVLTNRDKETHISLDNEVNDTRSHKSHVTEKSTLNDTTLIREKEVVKNLDKSISSELDKMSSALNISVDINIKKSEVIELTINDKPIQCPPTIDSELHTSGTKNHDAIIKNTTQVLDEDDSEDDVFLDRLVKNKRLSQGNISVKKVVNTRNKKPNRTRGKQQNISNKVEVEVANENVYTPDVILNKSDNIAEANNTSAPQTHSASESYNINTTEKPIRVSFLGTSPLKRKRRARLSLKRIPKKTSENCIIDSNLDNKCDSTYNKENKDDVINNDKKVRREKVELTDENSPNKTTSPKVEASAMAEVVNICTSPTISDETTMKKTAVSDVPKISSEVTPTRKEDSVSLAESDEPSNLDANAKPGKRRSQTKKLKNIKKIPSETDLTTELNTLPLEDLVQNVSKQYNAPEIKKLKVHLDLGNEESNKDDDKDCNNVNKPLIFKLDTNSKRHNETEAEDMALTQLNVEVSKPLRRSNRRKSIHVETAIDDQETYQPETVIESKAPITKKQLIFSKLLLDEENRIEQESRDKDKSHSLLQLPELLRSDPTNVDKVSSIGSIMLNVSNSDVSNDHLNVNSSNKKHNTTKRRKSLHTKRSTKTKSLSGQHTSENSKTSVDDEFDPSISTTMKTKPRLKTLIRLEAKTIILDEKDVDFNQPETDICEPKNSLETTLVVTPEIEQNDITDKNQDTVSDDVSNGNNSRITQKVNKKITPMFFKSRVNVTKRKTLIDNSPMTQKINKKIKPMFFKSRIHVAKRKTLKLLNTVIDTEEKDEDMAEMQKVDSATNIRNETNKSTCYNMPRAAARTRSKSVLQKSILDIDVYDPYNIELDDLEERMLEKLEPVTKKARRLKPKAKHLIKDNVPKDEKTVLLDNPLQDVLKELDNDVSKDLTTDVSKELTKDEITNINAGKVLSKGKKRAKCKATVKAIQKISRKKTTKKSKGTPSENITHESSYNKQIHKAISSDTDESSKSDIPLKNYVTDASKCNKKMKSKNKDEDQIAKKEEVVEKSEEKKKKNADGKRNKRQQEEVKPDALIVDKETAESADDRRSEQFMESFGFFSERKRRKSNLLASKKISETFHIIANDDIDFEPKERPPKKDRRKSVSSDGVSEVTEPPVSAPQTQQSVDPRRARRVKNPATYCTLCKKEFRRPDNFLRHQINMFHVYKLSQNEMNVELDPLFEKPSYLVIYKQHLTRLKRLTEKIMRKNKKLGLDSETAPKIELPTFTDIMTDATIQTNNILSGMQKERELGLSGDDETFLHCCELLQDGAIPYGNRYIPGDFDLDETSSDSESDADQHSIPATTTMHTEQIVNTEKDNAFPTVTSQMLDHEIKPKKVEANGSAVDNEMEIAPECLAPPSETFSSPTADSLYSNLSELDGLEYRVSWKGKKPAPKPTEMYEFDQYEDKFDMIKRKSRSCAAAAKQPPQTADAAAQPVADSQKGKKKAEKKIKKTKKKSQSSIPTKAALKGFDAIKESTLDNDAKSTTTPPVEPSSSQNYPSPTSHGHATRPPRKKKKNNKKRKRKTSSDSANSEDERVRRSPARARKSPGTGAGGSRLDVYEFNEDADVDGTTVKMRVSRKSDLTATRAVSPTSGAPDPIDPPDLAEHKSDIASDESFVYMSDSANDIQSEGDGDEEHDGASSDSQAAPGRCAAPDKLTADPIDDERRRREARAKHAVMGKIFKHNALRTERRRPDPRAAKPMEPPKDLDQIFDSLLGGSDVQTSQPAPAREYNLSPPGWPGLQEDHQPCQPWRRLSPERCSPERAPPKCASPPPRWDYRGRPRHRTSAGPSPSPALAYPYYYRPPESPGRFFSPTRYRSVSASSFSSSEEWSRPRRSVRAPPLPKLKKPPVPVPTSAQDEPKIVVVKRPAGETRRSREAQDEQVPGTSRDVVPLMAEPLPASPPPPLPAQRARRKCALGKQNVLAESWSSESEAESRARARTRSAESLALPRRKKSGGARHKRQEPPRPSVAAPQPRARTDTCYSTPVPSPVTAAPASAAAADFVAWSWDASESPDPAGEGGAGVAEAAGAGAASTAADFAAWNWDASESPDPAGEGGAGEAEEAGAGAASAQQHGWIVGDSHKKLVTMLASIKVTSHQGGRREREERHSRHSHKHGRKHSDKKRHGKKRDDKKRRHYD